LLDEGANVNEQRSDGLTPLSRAALHGHSAVVLALINKGADLNARDRLGMTALDWAKSKGETDVVRILNNPIIIDAQASASDQRAERPITSEKVEELPSENSDEPTDDTLVRPEKIQTSETQPDHAFQSERNLLSPEPVTDSSPYGVTVPLDSPHIPSAESSTTLPQQIRENKVALHRFAVTKKRNPTTDNFAAPETVTPIPPKGSFTTEPNSRTNDLKADIPTPTFDTNHQRASVQSQPIPWLKYAGLALAIMIASAALTSIILKQRKSSPPNTDVPSIYDVTEGGVREKISPPTADVPSISPPQGEDAANPINSARAEDVRPTPTDAPAQVEPRVDARLKNDNEVLTAALSKWIAATNSRDINKQMSFYAPKLSTFYRLRDVSKSTVRREKVNLFAQARKVNIRMSEPKIRYSGNDRKATMRFRKVYSIDDGRKGRRGEVIQELVWEKTKDGWKLISERDVQVIK
jgi:ketosteroid isomerase-like protein